MDTLKKEKNKLHTESLFFCKPMGLQHILITFHKEMHEEFPYNNRTLYTYFIFCLLFKSNIIFSLGYWKLNPAWIQCRVQVKCRLDWFWALPRWWWCIPLGVWMGHQHVASALSGPSLLLWQWTEPGTNGVCSTVFFHCATLAWVRGSQPTMHRTPFKHWVKLIFPLHSECWALCAVTES